MRTLAIAACVVLVLSACRSEEAAEPTQVEITDTTVTAGSTSDTITPGTTERAATATSTVAPTPATRTSTSAPPGATVRPPAGGTTTPPPADAAPAPTSQIIDGRSVYQARCAACHGAAGQRAVGDGRVLRGGAIQKMAQNDIESRIRNSDAHRSINLAPDELRAVAAYVKALN